MKNSVHDNGGFIGRVADYAATDYYQALTTTTANVSSSAGYDLNNATYDNVSFTIGTNQTADIYFKPDGTTFFVSDINGTIRKYSMATPWDLSSSSYANSSLSASSAFGLYFKTDGTRLYYINNSIDKIIQVDLSTAWDLSTAGTEVQGAPAVGTIVRGVRFSSDGTKMYASDRANTQIEQFNLSTAWDISSSSASSTPSQTFNVGSQTTQPAVCEFNPSGTKMWVTDSGNDSIYEYSLSTAWSVSSASYSSISFDLSSEMTTPIGGQFKPDGTKMYIAGATNNKVYQYSTGTAYEVTNAPYTSVSIATGNTSTVGVSFSVDGTKVYFQSANDTKYATLSTPSDLNSAGSFTSVTGGSSLQSIIFRPDGLKVNWTRYDGYISFSNLTAAWELNSKGPTYLFDSGVTDLRSMQFNNDGTKVYLLKSGTIYSYPTTNYGLSGSIVNSTNSTSQSLTGTDQQGFRFNPDGTKLFVIHGNGYSSSILEYSLSTAYDITTIGSATTHTTTASQVSDATDIAFSHDGRKFFIVGANNSNVYEFGSNVVVNSIGDANKKNTGVWSMDADYLNAELQPTIPTNGLIALLDPANYTSGTTFADVSGNNNDMTLAGSPTHNTTNGGTFSFTTSQSMTTPNSGDMDRETLDYTVIYAAKINSTSSDRERVLQSVSNNWLLGFWDGIFNSYYAQNWVYRPSARDTNWRVFSATRNHSADQDVFYSNGVSLASNSLGSRGFRGLSVNNGSFSEPTDCEVGILLVYDRVLTATEITQVYDIYKSRYGLT